jgi:predicted RNase H-like HicB family nuclease
MKNKDLPPRRFAVRLSVDEGLHDTVYSVYLPIPGQYGALTKTIDEAKQMLLESIANDYVVVSDARPS